MLEVFLVFSVVFCFFSFFLFWGGGDGESSAKVDDCCLQHGEIGM